MKARKFVAVSFIFLSQSLLSVCTKYSNEFVAKDNKEFERVAQRNLFKNFNVERKAKNTKHQVWHDRELYARAGRFFNDTFWPDQWYLNRQGINMNVQTAWKRGITGKNVVIAVVDDGLNRLHPELIRAYDQRASADFVDGDVDPYNKKGSSHGTKCAGVIAATAGNGRCGVGVAYNARIGGIRLLSNYLKTTDEMEATALGHSRQYIHIYSNSWGPSDSGWYVGGPGEETKRSIKQGVSVGRHRKGSIYVFAAGNGGLVQDMCGYNGYVNMIETIAISGMNKDGSVPRYAEPCAGILAVTFSIEAGDSAEIITADAERKCIKDFGRTSAAAAMASGLIALSLEANPRLTWRDVQHLIARSSRTVLTPRSSRKIMNTWKTNQAGLNVSDYFGFGLMDAGKMVELAANWKNVPKQLKCIRNVIGTWTIPSRGRRVFIPVNVTQQSNEMDDCSRIQYLEHVQVEIISFHSTRRGTLELELQSPGNTTSRLLSFRPWDAAVGSRQLRRWTVLSVQFWGERATGQWKLHLRNTKRYIVGTLRSWRLILYGTATNPLAKNSHVSATEAVTISAYTRPKESKPTKAVLRPFIYRGCRDKNKYCRGMVRAFGCDERATFNTCPRTCGACPQVAPTKKRRPNNTTLQPFSHNRGCRDINKYCKGMVRAFGCDELATFNTCPRTCGAC